jgi:predicted esterase
MRIAVCRTTLLSLLTFAALFATAQADFKGAVPPDQATFSPGKETKILDPATGGLGYYVIYVPKDYAPEREWPTIFCYHGSGGNPTAWPFKELTDGQGYIVVGMEYLKRGNGEQVAEDEVENLKRIAKYVKSKLHVNRKLVFMGGFSQGGWSTASFSNRYIDPLAGLVILGAGGSPGGDAISSPAKLKGKPVFIGVGENDQFLKNAKEAQAAYTAKGADVSFEAFKDLGHSVDTKSKLLKDWLTKNGPQNQLIAALAVAKAAERNNKLGEAYTLYTAAGKMNGGQEAADAAKAIEDAAEKKLADAESAVTAKKYPDAVKLLVSVAETYAGSPMAEKAKTRVMQIQSDPAIKAEVEQAKLDARAEAVEQQAQGAEKVKDYARAITLYETYVAQYAKASHYAAVKAHYDELKANKAVLASAKSQAAERECKGWLSTADNYIKNGLPEKAKPYLQKIVEKYADTEWATEARKRMEEMKK